MLASRSIAAEVLNSRRGLGHAQPNHGNPLSTLKLGSVPTSFGKPNFQKERASFVKSSPIQPITIRDDYRTEGFQNSGGVVFTCMSGNLKNNIFE